MDYYIDVEPTCKISELKEIISKKFNFQLNQIFLIYNKNILLDNETISSIKYDVERFIILHKQIKPIQNSKPSKSQQSAKDQRHMEALRRGRGRACAEDSCEEEYDENLEGEYDDDEIYGDNEEEEEFMEEDQLDGISEAASDFYEHLDANLKRCFDEFKKKGFNDIRIMNLFRENGNNFETLKQILKDTGA